MFVHPSKTDAPLAVDPDGPLALALALQSLKLIAGRNAQVFHHIGRLDHLQLAQRRALHILLQTLRTDALPDQFGFTIGKAPDHKLL